MDQFFAKIKIHMTLTQLDMKACDIVNIDDPFL